MNFDSLLQAAEQQAQSDQPWLRSCRISAAESARELGMPTLKTEDWKYTNLKLVSERDLRLASDEDLAQVDDARIEALMPPMSAPNRLVFLNGQFSAAHSVINTRAGLDVSRFSELSDQQANRVGALLLDSDAVFSRFNIATLSDGLCLDVADDNDEEIEISLVFIGLHDAALLRSTRLAIFAGRHSRVRLIEEYVSDDDDQGVTNTVTDIQVAAGASVWHHRIQEEALESAQVGRINATVNRDALFHSDSVVFGGALTRVDIDVRLVERGAHCVLNGLFAVNGTQHVDHHTTIKHCVGDTHSSELYRGVLDGRSRGVFNGKVIVEQDAQKISAQQASNNLLLSREAEIDTKPELEIYADDVTCAHGATVGELDQNALFYLRSRGLTETDARALLIYAFAEKVVDAIPLEQVRRFVERRFIGSEDLSNTSAEI